MEHAEAVSSFPFACSSLLCSCCLSCVSLPADLLRCCLLSPPLPAAIHSLPSLRLSPLQALLPLLPASLLSSSSCEVPSVLTVCMLLTLSSQQESRGHSAFLRRYWNRKVVVPTNSDADKAEIPAAPGESKDANQLGRQSVMANALFSSTNTLQGLGLFGEHSNFSDRSQRADGRQALSDCLSDPGVVWREWKGNDQALPPETRRDFLTQLEVAASAATGATELLAVAAAAAAGSRMPLPSLQQAMLGGPQVGSVSPEAACRGTSREGKRNSSQDALLLVVSFGVVLTKPVCVAS